MKYDKELHMEDNGGITKVIDQIKPRSRVLEFGPASGRMTKYLHDELECEVFFVEIEEAAAKLASRYAEDWICGDIEEYEWLNRWENVRFDFITFADVLEHLKDPLNVLKKTRRILTEEGKVLISVPNVGHNSVMINLTNNIFQYTTLGLLDSTHTRLFSYFSLKKFCEEAGYEIIVEDATYSSVGENEIDAHYAQVEIEAEKVLKNREYGLVYQFVFALQKKDFCRCHEYNKEKRIIKNFPQRFMKLYLDNGAGWSEGFCVTKSVFPKETEIFDIDLSAYTEIQKIRIDPLDSAGIFCVSNLILFCENGEIEIKILPEMVNGYMDDENIIIANIDDPQIIIPLKNEWGRILRVKFLVNYIDFDLKSDTLYRIIQHFENRKNHLILLEEKLNKKMAEIDEMEQLVTKERYKNSQLEHKLSELERSIKVNAD